METAAKDVPTIADRIRAYQQGNDAVLAERPVATRVRLEQIVRDDRKLVVHVRHLPTRGLWTPSTPVWDVGAVWDQLSLGEPSLKTQLVVNDDTFTNDRCLKLKQRNRSRD